MELWQLALIVFGVLMWINIINWVLTSTKQRAVKVVCWLLHTALILAVIIASKYYIQCPQ